MIQVDDASTEARSPLIISMPPPRWTQHQRAIPDRGDREQIKVQMDTIKNPSLMLQDVSIALIYMLDIDHSTAWIATQKSTFDGEKLD